MAETPLPGGPGLGRPRPNTRTANGYCAAGTSFTEMLLMQYRWSVGVG
jgi:hypothetical protein